MFLIQTLKLVLFSHAQNSGYEELCISLIANKGTDLQSTAAAINRSGDAVATD